MPKKKQSTQTELFAHVKTAKTVSEQFPFNMVNNKKWQKNLKLVFHLSVSHTTIHVVKLILCLSSKTTMMNKHKREMATLMPFDVRQFKLGETSATKFRIWQDIRHIICPHKTNPKVST